MRRRLAISPATCHTVAAWRLHKCLWRLCSWPLRANYKEIGRQIKCRPHSGLAFEVAAQSLPPLKDLMLKFHFEELVPDQSVFVYPGDRYNHQVALKGNSCLLVYTYNSRAINLKSHPFKGNQLKFSWYNPRNGEYQDGGKIANKKSLEFDPPGKMEDGNDWILILEME